MARKPEWVLVPDTPQQIDEVARQCRKLVHRRALVAAGVSVVPIPGIDWLTDVGVRLTTQQAAKYVPVAGSAVSAALTYSALRFVCEQHIKQCIEVSRKLMLPFPA